jgi:hypothetical protein
MTTGAKGLTIREADPVADGARIEGVLSRGLPEAASRERLAWLYLGNPEGRSRVWLLEDPCGNAVGTGAAHFRSMHVRGEVVRAMVLGDFAIDPAHRSLGPAIRLLRAMLSPMEEGACAFSYDLPSPTVLQIHVRMGAGELAPLQRWVYLLRATPVFEKRWGRTARAALAGGLAGLALRARDALRRPSRGVSCEVLEGEPGPEFDGLDGRIGPSAAVRGRKSAAFLAWRYGPRSFRPHRIVAARRGGELVGWAIAHTFTEGVLTIVDLVSIDDRDVRRSLLSALIRIGREAGAYALSANSLATGPSADLFRESGFRPRERLTGPAVFVRDGSPLEATLLEPRNWWITDGDRDA